MSKKPDLQDFQTLLAAAGFNTDTLAVDVTQTLRQSIPLARQDLLKIAPTLPVLRAAPADSAPQKGSKSTLDLHLLSLLGTGGMGQVHLARQLNLAREVAVKTPHDKATQQAALSLLQEAYITGYLEHPNIVPIYTLGRNEDNQPLVVMKCIEGHSWQELLDKEEQFPPADLDYHIELLLQVCNALRFAHSRRVIHRDIKPENIMIGHFGEVYVLDWGVSISLEDDHPLLPTRASCQGISGTPGYLAPEMAEQNFAAQDERTDVYLLGATLHTLLTGRMRHNGPGLLQVLFAASISEPVEYEEHIPQELGQIANRACHVDPDQRFESVDAFAKALKGFLHHRESVAVSKDAEARLGQLHALLTEEEPHRGHLHDTFGECRFGFQQALRMWPENQQARQGLQHCLEEMARYHLAQSNLDSALSCIDDLPEPNPELQDLSQALSERLASERADLQRLKRLEDNLDLKTSMLPRRIVAFAIGLGFTISSVWSVVHQDTTPMAEQLYRHMASGVRNVIVALLIFFFLRKKILTNRANRNLIAVFFATIATTAFLRWTTWYFDSDIHLARIGDTMLSVLGIVAIGIAFDRRIAYLAVFYALAALIGALSPALILQTQAVATFFTFAGLVWLWRPQKNAPAK